MAFGGGRKFDQARRLGAALAYVGLANLDRVTVVGRDRRGAVAHAAHARQGAHFSRSSSSCAASSRAAPTDLKDALKTFVAQHKRRGLAVLISDLYDPAGFEAGINVLRFNKFEPLRARTWSTRTRRSPNLRATSLSTIVETGEEREVTVTATPARHASARRSSDYRTSIERFCVSRQVPYFAGRRRRTLR